MVKNEVVFIFLLMIFFGCSTSKKTEKINVIGEQSVVEVKEKIKVKDVVIGPTHLSKSENLVFVDKTKQFGLDGVKATSIYAIDFNNDSWTDLVILPNNYSAPIFFKFISDKKIFKKEVHCPFDSKLTAAYLNFVDFDKDGIIDVLAGVLNQRTELTKYPLRIFKGSLNYGKIQFKEIKNAFPTEFSPTASVSILDYDLDGKLDMFQGNWFDYSGKSPRPIRDRLFKGDGFKFTDVSSILEGESKDVGPTFGVSTCDIDQNGIPDILTTSSSGYQNKMWLGLYDKKTDGIKFKNYGKDSGFAADKDGSLILRGGGNSFFSVCADYNNDTVMDLILGELSHQYGQETRDRSSILTGSRLEFPPVFIRTEYYMDDGTDSWSQGDRRGVWFDYNIDGLLDVLVENSGFPPKSRLILFHQRDDHGFDDVADKVGIDILNPSGTIIVDINNDGLMDIITGQTSVRNSKIAKRIYLFENQFKRNGNRSIRFYLNGKKANGGGIGSMIIVKAGKTERRQWVEYTSGPFASQNESGVLFGLGTDSIEYVKVRWPILKKDRSGRLLPLTKQYDMSNLTFKKHISVILNDDGTFKLKIYPKVIR